MEKIRGEKELKDMIEELLELELIRIRKLSRLYQKDIAVYTIALYMLYNTSDDRMFIFRTLDEDGEPITSMDLRNYKNVKGLIYPFNYIRRLIHGVFKLYYPYEKGYINDRWTFQMPTGEIVPVFKLDKEFYLSRSADDNLAVTKILDKIDKIILKGEIPDMKEVKIFNKDIHTVVVPLKSSNVLTLSDDLVDLTARCFVKDKIGESEYNPPVAIDIHVTNLFDLDLENDERTSLFMKMAKLDIDDFSGVDYFDGADEDTRMMYNAFHHILNKCQCDDIVDVRNPAVLERIAKIIAWVALTEIQYDREYEAKVHFSGTPLARVIVLNYSEIEEDLGSDIYEKVFPLAIKEFIGQFPPYLREDLYTRLDFKLGETMMLEDDLRVIYLELESDVEDMLVTAGIKSYLEKGDR